MGKTITKEDIRIMHRKASRNEAIEDGNKNYGHKVHKSQKDFNRNKKPIHQVLSEIEDVSDDSVYEYFELIGNEDDF